MQLLRISWRFLLLIYNSLYLVISRSTVSSGRWDNVFRQVPLLDH